MASPILANPLLAIVFGQPILANLFLANPCFFVLLVVGFVVVGFVVVGFVVVGFVVVVWFWRVLDLNPIPPLSGKTVDFGTDPHPCL